MAALRWIARTLASAGSRLCEQTLTGAPTTWDDTPLP